MSEQPYGEDPSVRPEASGAEEPYDQASPPGPSRRGLGPALVALYLASVAAAGLLLWRSQPKGDERKGIKPAASLLAGLKQDGVGLISITGPIYPSEGGMVLGRGMAQWTRSLRRMAAKKEIKAIVLDINSPGGSVGSVQELYSLVHRVRAENKKPVVAILGDVAASGGYYVAAACDKIVAYPGTLLGSIGVIFQAGNVEELLRKIGVRSSVIKSGKMKDIGSMTRPMTPEERQLLQDLIDDAYGQFLTAVADGRQTSVEKIKPLADGRIFTGRQGLEAGLVDQLGDVEDAIALAGKLGGIEGKPQVIRDGDSLSEMLSLFESRLAGALFPQAAWLAELRLLGRGGLEYRWAP